PDITPDIEAYATKEVLQKAADGLMEEGRNFTGILYAGLMQTEEGTKVIEFNTRFGDPETQVVLPLLENDLVQVMEDVMAGKDAACVGVVVASKGYPNTYERGIPLPDNHAGDNAFIIQAGTKQTASGLVSNGGRVLLVGGIGDDLSSARNVAYEHLTVYDDSDAFFYRTDIGINK